jgi:hypothetical protein
MIELGYAKARGKPIYIAQYGASTPFNDKELDVNNSDNTRESMNTYYDTWFARAISDMHIVTTYSPRLAWDYFDIWWTNHPRSVPAVSAEEAESKELAAVRYSLAQIVRWTSDPRTRNEADRALRRIATQPKTLHVVVGR